MQWRDSQGQLRKEQREVMLAGHDPRVDDDSAASLIEAFVPLAHAEPTVPGATKLLLTLHLEDMFGLDWERLLRSQGWPSTRVVRHRHISDRRLLEPGEHPPRVLWVDNADSSQQPLPAALQRYFRVHRLSGLSSTEFGRTLMQSPYEIVHLLLAPRWAENRATTQGVLTMPGLLGDTTVDADALSRFLRRSRTRLLIVSPADWTALAPSRDLAHRLQLLGGPTTVVRPHDTLPDWNQRYLNLVHDFPIDDALIGAPTVPASFFSAIGGNEVLRIRPRAETLSRQLDHQLTVAHELASKTRGDVAGRLTPKGARVLAPSDLIARLTAKQPRVWNYARESGAWEPLRSDEAECERDARELRELRQATERVLNVGLERDDGRRFERRDVLPSSYRCTLVVQVAPVARWSLVQKAAPIAEQALAGHYGPEGVRLRVVVFAPGFTLKKKPVEHELLVPPPPQPSEPLRISLRAPTKRGRYRLRVGLYHENNLLQSVLLRLRVVSQDTKKPRGDQLVAQVEFALSATLDERTALPPRTLNILSNAADDGSHTLAVVANGVAKQFDISAARAQSAVRAARTTLDAIAADRSGSKPIYRFDANNSAPLAAFEKDLVGLADCGAELFLGLVVADDHAFEKQLLDALGSCGAAIQVAVTASADYVFPWALVYDHAHVGRRQRLCPHFRANWTTPKFDFSKQRCLQAGCAYRHDPSIVCPSGFWGFKHGVEQPASVRVNGDPGASKVIVTEIPGARQRATALMAVSRRLEQVGDHESELKQDNAFTYDVEDTLADTWQGMNSAAARGMRLLYFYCHGGRDDTRVWLGLGSSDEERLLPSDLRQIQWAGLNPLVLINGCHTVDVKPDDLLHFTRVFARCDAAGVIGTEISIPEQLARDFARGFLERFATGAPVGEAIRTQRLSLLARGNLLGLAYTPYCSNSLHMI
jgi:hypothetical protein